MQNGYKRVELVSNIAIIIVAIALVFTLASRVFNRSSAAQSPTRQNEIMVGTKLAASDIDWSKSKRTLVMALSTTCHFCAESAPFYQQLSQQRAGRPDVRLITIMPQGVDESNRYLNDKRIVVDEVHQTGPDETFVTGTPTLILVDEGGSVVESWTGRLPPEIETDVISKVFGG